MVMVNGHARDHIEALNELFLAYFHVNWDIDFDDPDEVLRYFVESGPELASQAAGEMAVLLSAASASDDQLW